MERLSLVSVLVFATVAAGKDQRLIKKGPFKFNFGKSIDTTCTASDNSTGTCMTKAECDLYGGNIGGTCLHNAGICCTFSIGCNGYASRNLTHFSSPSLENGGYPFAGHCQVKIYKCSSDICQLRLDFIKFSLVQPDPIDQVCSQDQFWVSGSPYPIPMICGENAGQHMYVDIAPGKLHWELTVITKDSGPVREWKIQTTQIPCQAEYKAPFGCLQYFQGPIGTLQSFNFDVVKIDANTPGRQLSKQDYTICVRTEAGYCGIAYTVCPDTLNSYVSTFTISGVYGNGYIGQSDGFCNTDWILVPNGHTEGSQTSNSKFCGTSVQCTGTPGTCPPQTINSESVPFEIRFHSNGRENTKSGPLEEVDKQNMGFCFNYEQQPCGH